MTALPRHTLLEDAQGLLVSIVGGAFGILLLRTAGLMTGGTAGLALLISYATGWAFGWLFFVVNLPFYAFAWWKKGPAFAVKSFLAVTAVSALAEGLPRWITITALHPGLAAVLFGVIAGVGLLGLFRHGASLGGVSIVAVVLQDTTGIRAGWIQLGWDAALFAVSLFILAPAQVAWSLVGAAVLNVVIAMNHRRDWYLPG